MNDQIAFVQDYKVNGDTIQNQNGDTIQESNADQNVQFTHTMDLRSQGQNQEGQ
jgi:hypothetical protein